MPFSQLISADPDESINMLNPIFAAGDTIVELIYYYVHKFS